MYLTKNCISPDALGVFHIVGVGGVGMSAIAKVMFSQGYLVQGSNIIANSNTNALEEMGVRVYIGHKASNLSKVHNLIISSVIAENNVEVVTARKKNIPVLKRHEILSVIMQDKYNILVSGSHGKTTTTAFLAYILQKLKMDPTFIVGGIMNNFKTNAYLGESQYFVLEADESDRTFNNIPKNVTVVTNIDKEHLDNFKDFEELLNDFKKFITIKNPSDFSVVCLDDPGVQLVLNKISNVEMEQLNLVSYGIDNLEANLLAINIEHFDFCSKFDVRVKIHHDDEFILKDIQVSLPAKHNVLNALAAITVAVKLGVDKNRISKILENFNGVERRFQPFLKYKESILIDDYAHHPSEVLATIGAAKDIVKKSFGRVIVFFQPHKISRVKMLYKEFIHSLLQADVIYVSRTYNVEDSILDCQSESLVVDLGKIHANSFFLENLELIPDLIKNHYQKNDIFLIIGAGNIANMVSITKHKLRDIQ